MGHPSLIGFLLSMAIVPPCAAAGRKAQPKPAATPVDIRSINSTNRVEIRGEWLYVDGEPFVVKGIGYSPYRPGQTPWKDRVSLAVMEQDFKRIAEAGFNTIRTWSPLSADALELADRYGLMVLQGIWIETHGHYTSPAFQEAMLTTIARNVEDDKGHHNILAFLIGNELSPEVVHQTGIHETEALLRRAAHVVKEHDPSRLVSYSNWPSLASLDSSMWDVVGFNVYPYEPSSISFGFGFRSYLEHLKRTVARGKPLLVTEVGLSASPIVGSRPGYGGMSPAEQAAGVVALWDDLFQAGAQGGVLFEWNDEWWKPFEAISDAESHDAKNPEEWFGLMEFPSRHALEGLPRPAYHALKEQNQAMLLSPVTGERYHERLPVTIYATASIAQIRVRLDQEKWSPATKLNRHWWKTLLMIGSKERAGEHRLVMEASDANHRVILRRERPVWFGTPQPPATITLVTDRTTYEVDDALEPIRYTITVLDGFGKPLAKQPVYVTIREPQVTTDLTQMKTTDDSGRIEGAYLVHDPGFIIFTATTARMAVEPLIPERRVGAESVVVVRHSPSLTHQPSVWEERIPPSMKQALQHRSPAFKLANAGTERLVDYERYGRFVDIGKPTYRYEIKNLEGLADAVGEGIYPNELGILKDPAYQSAKASGRLEGSHWDFTFLDDPQLAFFKWAQTEEEPGVKQFYTALALERAELWLPAVKAYYAVIVHDPASVGWTAFDPPTPWYVGKVARDKIEAILRLHPELGMRLAGCSIVVEQGFDNRVDNDRILPSPGKLVPVSPDAVNPPLTDLATLRRKREIGKGRVRIIQYENGHWQLLVDGQPWTVQGLTYRPTAVGETPDEGSVIDWISGDRQGNGVLDVLETFVDANGNDRQDPDEPTAGDFQLLKDMGVNTLRLYHTDHNTAKTKPLLRWLYQQYGFMVMMGDFVGKYTIGSGAKWEQGTDYLNPAQRKQMLKHVKQMVREYKNEPYLLLWVLGNENNYDGVHGIVGGTGNAGRYPNEYYAFINELASWIHQEDPNHPVAIANGDLLFLDVIAKQAPAVDIFGANVYRGWQGFGRSFFEEVGRLLDRPVLITEFGCPAYQTNRSREIAERDQALYHFGNWVDIADNLAGRGVGNAIGGVVFEWMDEWWKGGQPPRFSPRIHEIQPNWAGPYPGGWNFEEWYGLVSQGDGNRSPYLRELRPSYRLYQQLWKRANAATAP